MVIRRKSKNDPIKSAYWLQIRQRRIAAGISREELAARSRMYELSVKNYETGKTEPTLQALVQLAAGLNLSGIQDLVSVDLDAVREVIAADAALKAPPSVQTPTISEPTPDPAKQFELQPAPVIESEPSAPRIGEAAIVAAETFKNPVGDMIAAQEAKKQ